MHKEIHEQPAVLGGTLLLFASPADHRITLPELPVDFASLPRLAINRLRHRGLCLHGRALLVRAAGSACRSISTSGSEFRYRGTPLVPGSAALFVSQSRRDHGHARGQRGGQGAGAGDDRASSTCPTARSRAKPTVRVRYACRSRDRRRLDQGVHDPAGHARLPGDRRGLAPAAVLDGPSARPSSTEGPRRRRRCAQPRS